MMKVHCVKKIIFASSSFVYGDCSADKFNEEIKTSKPISLYAASKLSCEQIIYTYTKLYEITAVCLRFFTVNGPKQRPDLMIRTFIEQIKQNQPISVYGDGTAIRDFTYIDDIVEGICASIDYDKTPYEIINLGGSSPKTLNEVILIIEEILGKKAKINNLPVHPGDVIRTASDIRKAKELLGYKPKTNLKEGIKKFVEWSFNNSYKV